MPPRTARLSALLVLALLCCGRGWSDLEDCPTLRDTEQRDECYAATLPPLFATEPERAAELVESAVSDPAIRDFIYLQATEHLRVLDGRWCERIRDEVLRRSCETFVSRPHLHRELAGPSAPGRSGAPPAPPPALPGSPPPQAGDGAGDRRP